MGLQISYMLTNPELQYGISTRHTQKAHLRRRITGQLTDFPNDPIALDSLIYISEQLYRCLNAYRESGNADAVAEAILLLLDTK